jgi:two-component system chemotaxis response regulator CheY
MELFQHFNRNDFLGCAYKIKQDPSAWQFIEVSLTGKTSHNASFIAKKLKDYFSGKDGTILICGSNQILAIVNMGREINLHELTSGINKKLPENSCTAEASSVTEEGILRFQLQLQDIESARKEHPLLVARRERTEKIALIVDDDLYIRTVLKKLLQSRARVVELDDTTQIVETYLDVLPDIVFVDIHLPGGSGIEALDEILGFDASAYLVVMSSDSVRSNVLDSKRFGAKGFLAKPFTPDKVESCLMKCPTMIASPVIGWK